MWNVTPIWKAKWQWTCPNHRSSPFRSWALSSLLNPWGRGQGAAALPPIYLEWNWTARFFSFCRTLLPHKGILASWIQGITSFSLNQSLIGSTCLPPFWYSSSNYQQSYYKSDSVLAEKQFCFNIPNASNEGRNKNKTGLHKEVWKAVLS